MPCPIFVLRFTLCALTFDEILLRSKKPKRGLRLYRASNTQSKLSGLSASLCQRFVPPPFADNTESPSTKIELTVQIIMMI